MAEVDYLQDAKGDHRIRNPNASTTCGCDRSLRPKVYLLNKPAMVLSPTFSEQTQD